MPSHVIVFDIGGIFSLGAYNYFIRIKITFCQDKMTHQALSNIQTYTLHCIQAMDWGSFGGINGESWELALETFPV